MTEKIEMASAAIIKVIKLNTLGKVNKIIMPIIPVKISTKLVTENKVGFNKRHYVAVNSDFIEIQGSGVSRFFY